MMTSTVASARTETLRWTHDNPSVVERFIVHYGSSSRNYTAIVNVPPVLPDAQGIFTFDIDVPDDATIYVALTARDSAGQESEFSNEGTRSPVPNDLNPLIGKPGTPYVIPEP